MTTLFICVFEDANEVALGTPIQEIIADISGSSVQSVAITGANRRPRRVRLFADANCFVTWGDNPTATADGTSGRPMGSENPEYFDIEAGQKIAVIERT